MVNTTLRSSIRATIIEFLPHAKILLFGSRARNDFNINSDYDILIITKQDFSPTEKISWASRIHKALVYSLNAPVDILLNSEQEVEQKKDLPGHVVRWAMKEGVEI